ncbi:MAG: hypothetical protein VX717_01130, partial [Candidatus Thermoplasmatota archaeon]|nr:hypothetical protein [Candidatus Thermoplasmatota archaeon]
VPSPSVSVSSFGSNGKSSLVSSTPSPSSSESNVSQVPSLSVSVGILLEESGSEPQSFSTESL